MSELDVARERERKVLRTKSGTLLKDIERKKEKRERFRGVPAPPAFDWSALPDSTHLNETETAGILRRAKSTLEVWRLRPDHPLKWKRVAGRILYELASIREMLKGN